MFIQWFPVRSYSFQDRSQKNFFMGRAVGVIKINMRDFVYLINLKGLGGGEGWWCLKHLPLRLWRLSVYLPITWFHFHSTDRSITEKWITRAKTLQSRDVNVLKHRNNFMKYFNSIIQKTIAETGQSPTCCMWGVSGKQIGATRDVVYGGEGGEGWI